MPDYLVNGKGHLPRMRNGRTSNRRRVMTMNSTKIALVTGASRGLGRNIAIALARKGVDVIGTYHSNKAEADASVAAIEALGRKAVMFQLDTGTTAGFAAFAVDLRQALRPGGTARSSTTSSTMPASASTCRSRRRRKPTSTG